jgi:hypothetical protein
MSRIRVLRLFSLLGLASTLSVPLPSDSDSQTVFTAAGPKPADLPHPDPTHSFWTHSPGANPLAGEGSTGALTDEADVCIIGSGITGVSAAYHLANAVQQGSFPIPDGETKLRAVILEARDFCKSFHPSFHRIVRFIIIIDRFWRDGCVMLNKSRTNNNFLKCRTQRRPPHPIRVRRLQQSRGTFWTRGGAAPLRDRTLFRNGDGADRAGGRVG